MTDRRNKRITFPNALERRIKPYVYKYEIKEIANILNLPETVLQEMIHEKAEEYHLMSESGSGR
jgi:hypothetical protein